MSSGVSVWAGIAMRFRDHTRPDGFVLLTMQMVPYEGTFDFQEEYEDVGLWGMTVPTRARVGRQELTVRLRGGLVGPDHWDRWRPDDYRGPAGELPGRHGVARSRRMELPGG